jgi:cyclopropane fatty-acyl-phospholipid synthase-like methyltransferase
VDKEFWLDRYDNDKSIPEEPSLFAQWCISKGHIKQNDVVLELGHGNGRDALYFHQKGIRVVGIDQSGKVWDGEKIKLMRGDFTNFDDSITNLNRLNISKVDCVYSRFTWHSISKKQSEETLVLINNIIKENGKFLLECRTVFDDLYGVGSMVESNTFKHPDGHTRRFIAPGEFIDDLIFFQFKEINVFMDRGLAPFRNEDPLVMRIMAKKEMGK